MSLEHRVRDLIWVPIPVLSCLTSASQIIQDSVCMSVNENNNAGENSGESVLKMIND